MRMFKAQFRVRCHLKGPRVEEKFVYCESGRRRGGGCFRMGEDTTNEDADEEGKENAD